MTTPLELMINKRRRGGQPGNTNALRHGFYSAHFTANEKRSLNKKTDGEFTDELTLTRVQIWRVAEILKDYKSMSLHDFLSATNALSLLVDRLQRLCRTQQLLFNAQSDLDQAAEEALDLEEKYWENA